jgi:predicted GTPase
MAHEMATFYRPRAQDPYGQLTIPEVLAVAELVSHDLAELVERYLPGGRRMTIDDWRSAQRWTLRVGADRYRQLVRERTPVPAAAASDNEPAPPEAATQVTVTVIGQVKAGKSSVINALLGERRAKTDVLPATAGLQRYELQPPGISTKLVIQDTVGYGHSGPRADQLSTTREAARQSDLLLLVLHARNPARQADQVQLQDLYDWFAARPDLKRPPILAVLTHIDLLSPSMEWSPPYDWRTPTRPKAQSIHDAVEAARKQLGDHLTGIVPVCAIADKTYNVAEGLLPAIAEQLDEAHGVGLLRCLMEEANAGTARVVLRQILSLTKKAAGVAWEGIAQTKDPRPKPAAAEPSGSKAK